MRGNKKLLGLLPSLLCVFAMLLSACSTNNTTQAAKAPDSKQIFRYPTEIEPDFTTIDPALVDSLGDGYALDMIFTGLVQFDNNGNIKDQLAQSHQISQDGLTYTFHLRPNLKFSDGNPLTAHDAAYSINRTVQPDTHSHVSTYLQLINGYTDVVTGKASTLSGVVVQDDQTLSIKINKPAAYFLDQLTYPTSYVVEQSLIDKYKTSWTDHLTEGGGAGPFKVKSYVHGQTFDVVPNPDYYGPKPALKEIDMPFSGDPTTTYKTYKNGQYDQATILGPDVKEAQGRADSYSGPQLASTYINLNFLAKPFNNLEIRKAFALALNKEILTTVAVQSAGTATNNIVPKGMYGYDANLKGPDGTTKLTGNQTQAQQLLAQGMREEGYSSASNLPTLTLTSTQASPELANVTQEAAKEWKEVLKVDVQIDNNPDTKELPQKIHGATGNDGLQMWAYGWQADYTDPQDWLTVFFGKQPQDNNTNNYGDQRNERAKEEQDVQTELGNADTELGSTKRLSLYNDAEQKLVNDVAWIPLFQVKFLVVQNPKLHGYKTNSLQITDPDSWSDVYFTV